MGRQYFGTDGIRGRAGEFPLDVPTVRVIGASLARHFTQRTGRTPSFVLGRDTRESGAVIEAALIAGLESGGAKCSSAGVVTTPGVAYLTRPLLFDMGIPRSDIPGRDGGVKNGRRQLR